MARGQRHPLHPPFVHLPIGLLLASPLWDALAWRDPSGPWWTIAFWGCVVGLSAAVLAIVTGLIDLRGVPQRAYLVLLAHLSAMAAATLIALISLCVCHGHAALPHAVKPLPALIADAVAAAMLAVGGWFGGHLVYRHRVGVSASTGDG